MGRGATSLHTSPRVFGHFLAPGNPWREWGRMRANERFVQDEENTRGQGREGSLWVEKHSSKIHRYFNSASI